MLTDDAAFRDPVFLTKLNHRRYAVNIRHDKVRFTSLFPLVQFNMGRSKDLALENGFIQCENYQVLEGQQFVALSQIKVVD